MVKIKMVGALMAAFILCATVSAGSIAIYDRFYATKIVALDLKEFNSLIQKGVTDGKIDEKQIDIYLEHLDNTISSQGKNTVVLLSDVVASKNVETVVP